MRVRKTLVAVTAATVATACSAGVVIAGGTGPSDNTKEIGRALDSDKPKNVILLIGDGTGDSELTIGRYYLNGANGPPMAYETLPFTGEYHTWSLKYGPGPDYAPDYVPDSAPTAVAWSTGQEDRRRAALAGDEHGPDGARLERGFTTTFEIMKARRKAVGNVTTVGAQRRDAGGSVLAHLASRMPGPG